MHCLSRTLILDFNGEKNSKMYKLVFSKSQATRKSALHHSHWFICKPLGEGHLKMDVYVRLRGMRTVLWLLKLMLKLLKNNSNKRMGKTLWKALNNFYCKGNYLVTNLPQECMGMNLKASTKNKSREKYGWNIIYHKMLKSRLH